MNKELYVKAVLIVLFIILGICLKAQTNLDSLHAIWHDQNQPDSTRVVAYKDYIWNGFLFSKPDTAFILAEELIDYWRNNNYPKAQALGYKYQGISWYVRGDFINALKYYMLSLKIEEDIGDLEGINGSLNNIGLIYSDQGAYQEALSYFTQSLEIANNIGDQDGISSALSNIGIIYIKLSDYSNALDYSTRSLEINEQIDDQYGVSLQLNNIGTIYINQGEYYKALDFYSRGLKIKEQIGDNIGIGITLNNIGDVYQVMGNYPKALDYYTQSLKTREQIGDQSRIAYSLNNVGYIYFKQRDYYKAIDYCQRGYKLALEAGILELQKKGCSCLYESYKAMGNGIKALEYHELINVIDDSLHVMETAKKLQQMEFAKQVLADSLRQEEENLRVQIANEREVSKKNRTRNIVLIIALFLLMGAIAIHQRMLRNRRAKKAIEKEKDRSEKLLLNILPSEIAKELKEKGKADPRKFEMVSILFSDFEDFTQLSEKLDAKELVEEINACFKPFDAICAKYGIEKIKTINDTYMAAGGLPVPDNDFVKNTVLAGLEMQEFIINRKKTRESEGKIYFKMRVGIHTGSVIAGIVGVTKFQYDIWGDAVNTAARVESAGETGKVNISRSTYELIKNDPAFKFQSRGKINVKGKGDIEMWFVEAT